MAKHDTLDITKTGEFRLFTDKQYLQLIENGKKHAKDHDAIPCVYLYNENRAYLLSEIPPDRPGFVFGLKDYRNGDVSSGYILLEEIVKYHELNVLFNDVAYETNYTHSVFRRLAIEHGEIIPSEEFFEDEFKKIMLRP